MASPEIQYIEMPCPQCRRNLRVRTAYLGQSIACKYCSNKFVAKVAEQQAGPSSQPAAPPPVLAPEIGDPLRIQGIQSSLEQVRQELNRVAALRQELATVQAERAQLLPQVQALQERSAQTERLREAAQVERDQALDRLRIETAAAQDLRSRVQVLEESLSATAKSHEENANAATAAFEEAHRQWEIDRNALETRWQKEHQDLAREAEDRFQQEQARSAAELQQWRERHEEAQSQFAGQHDSLQTTLEAAQQEANAFKRDHTAALEIVQDLERGREQHAARWQEQEAHWQAEIARLTQELDKSVQERDKAARKSQEVVSRAESLHTELTSLCQEMTGLQKNLQAVQDQGNQEREQWLTQQQAARDHFDRETSALRQELERGRQETALLRKKHDATSTEAAGLARQRDLLATQRQEVQKQLDAVRACRDADREQWLAQKQTTRDLFDRETTALRRELERWRQDAAALRQERDASLKQVGELAGKQDLLTTRNSELQKQLEAVRAQADEEREQAIAHLQTTRDLFDRETGTLRNELDRWRQESAVLRQERDAALEQVGDMARKRDLFAIRHTELQKQFEAVRANRDEEREQGLAHLQSTRDIFDQETLALRSELERWRQEAAVLRQERDAGLEQVSGLAPERDLLATQHQELQKQLEAAWAQGDADRKQWLEQLQTQRDNFDRETGALRIELERSHHEAVKLRQEREADLEKVSALAPERELLANQVKELQKQLEDARTQGDEERQQWLAKEQTTHALLNQEAGALRGDIERWRQEAAVLRQERDTSLEHLSCLAPERDLLALQLKELQEQLEAAQAHRDEEREQWQERQQTARAFVDQDTRALQDELEGWRHEAAVLQQERDAGLKQLSGLAQERDVLAARQLQFERSWRETQDRWEREDIEMHDELERAVRETKQAAAEIQALQMEIAELRQAEAAYQWQIVQMKHGARSPQPPAPREVRPTTAWADRVFQNFDAVPTEAYQKLSTVVMNGVEKTETPTNNRFAHPESPALLEVEQQRKSLEAELTRCRHELALMQQTFQTLGITI